MLAIAITFAYFQYMRYPIDSQEKKLYSVKRHIPVYSTYGSTLPQDASSLSS